MDIYFEERSTKTYIKISKVCKVQVFSENGFWDGVYVSEGMM